MKKQYIAACLVGISALNFETAAKADTILNYARVGGNQQGYDLGMDFTVNSAVSVSALGTFDANIASYSDPVTTAQIATSLGPTYWSSGTPLEIYVGIFDVRTGLEVSPTAAFDYTGASSYFAIAGSIFQSITPFTLGPGTYSIVASGYTYLFQNGNTLGGSPEPTFNTLGGALTLLPNGARFNGSGGNGAEAFAFPTAVDGQVEKDGNPSFLAGTFIANNGTVPDGGSTVALLGFALLGIGSLRKKLNR
jgi:hypothetical protein